MLAFLWFIWVLVATEIVVPTPSLAAEEVSACHRALSVPLYLPQKLANGSLALPGGLTYPPKTFWKEKNLYYGCPCLVTNCLRKCCKIGQTMNETCEKNVGGLEKPLMVEIWKENEVSQIVDASKYFALVVGKTCVDTFSLQPKYYDEDSFKIYTNGSLVYNNSKTSHDAEYFCVENDLSNEMLVLVCASATPEMPMERSLQYFLYPIFLIISSVFLLATLLAYGLSPEARNLHGRCVSSHAGSLLLGYLALIVIQLRGTDISQSACVVFAFIAQYGLLSTFFWLNVMCFDIWWTFSGFRTMTGSLNQTKTKKFVLYSIYAWGSPLLMFTATLVMQVTPGIPDTMIKPKIGMNKCWFHDKLATFAYFTGPVAILLSSNIFFFITTMVKILKLKRETAILKNDGSQMHNEHDQNKQRFKLYMKLFLVMGLNWIMELISWAVEGPEYVWYVTDIGNTLQGVLIFFFCVWNTKIRYTIYERLRSGQLTAGQSFRQRSTNAGQPSTSSKYSDISSSQSVNIPLKEYKRTQLKNN